MPARSLAAKTSAALLVLFVAILLLPLGEGCQTTCSFGSTTCSGGEVCVFPAGGGCSAQGHCGQSHQPCVAQQTPTVLCGCSSGDSLSLFCISEDGLTEPTTKGSCPATTDAGDDAGGATATDASGTGDSEGIDSGGIADAGGQ
jgi:hypothetical protein